MIELICVSLVCRFLGLVLTNVVDFWINHAIKMSSRTLFLCIFYILSLSKQFLPWMRWIRSLRMCLTSAIYQQHALKMSFSWRQRNEETKLSFRIGMYIWNTLVSLSDEEVINITCFWRTYALMRNMHTYVWFLASKYKTR